MKTTGFEKGDEVLYHSGHGEPERGVVTVVGVLYVFVRFGDDVNGKACDPLDLTRVRS